jgi:hypothetical protein
MSFAWAGVDGHQHEAILRAGESGVKVADLPEDVRRGRMHFQDLKNQFRSQPNSYWQSSDQFMERRQRIPVVEDKPLASFNSPPEFFGFKKTDIHEVDKTKKGPFLTWDGDQHPFVQGDENEPETEQWEVEVEERLHSAQQTGAGKHRRKKSTEREGSDEPVPCWAMLPSSDVVKEEEVRDPCPALLWY